MFDDLFESLGETDKWKVGPSVLRRQFEAEQAAHSERHEAFLKELFTGALPDTSKEEYLRAVVENDQWFVATSPDGAFEIKEVKAGRHKPAIDESGKQTDKKHKGGRGGRLLRVYAAPPDASEQSTLPLDGRALIRALPETIDGLLISFPGDSRRELGAEHFPALRELVVACELEARLVGPAPDQVEALKCATWLVEMSGQKLRLDTLMDKGRVAQVYTHADKVLFQFNQPTLVPMPGEQLFSLVAQNAEVDGIVVNPSRHTGWGDKRLFNLVLSPGFACRVLEGTDIRPGAHPLPARSIEEVELWLQLNNFPSEERRLIDAPYPTHTLLRAVVPQGSAWRLQETLTPPSAAPGPTWSPVFTLPAGVQVGRSTPQSTPVPVGQSTPVSLDKTFNDEIFNDEILNTEPSRILCAGLLARELNAGAMHGADAATYWKMGRWLGPGRLVSPAEQKLSRRRLAVALELARLLPPGADQIPRSALLTVKGAAFLAEHPHGGSRAWIEATIRIAKIYTKRWVWLVTTER